MQIREVDPFDDGQIGRAHALAERTRAHYFPEQPQVTERRFAAEFRNPPVNSELHLYTAQDGEEALGFTWVYMPHSENSHYAEAELEVHPDHRREGIGTALLDHLLDVARAKGRTELVIVVHVAWGDGPARSEDGPRFLERRGFKAALTEVDRRLRIDELDTELERSLWAEAVSASEAEYELVTWTGRTPEEYLEPLCRIDSMVFDEIPLGDVELKRREVDVEQQRARDDRNDAMGTVPFRAVAVHRASGRVAANTVCFTSDDADHAHQGITITDPAHRGHRLGLLVKLANLRRLRERAGHVEEVWTGNADVNSHMVAINERLGFEAVDARVSYRITVEV